MLIMNSSIQSTDIDDIMDTLNVHVFYYETVAIKLINCSQMYKKLSVQLIENILLYGEMECGENRLENDFCRLNSITDRSIKQSARFHLIENLHKLKLNEIRQLKDMLLNKSIELNKKKGRYYNNSYQHRIKLRIFQALGKLFFIDKLWDERLLLPTLYIETNQPSITYILECIIAQTIDQNRLTDIAFINQVNNITMIFFFIIDGFLFLFN